MQKISLLIGTLFVFGGVLVVFFGGTWAGVKLGLEIMGALWLLQTAYIVVKDSQKEEIKKQELEKITKKYFE